jgi:hypothetical protein
MKARRKTIPAKVKRDVLSATACAYCGDEDRVLVIEHIIPVARGGTNDRDNLAAACGTCNTEKLDFTPAEWQAWREEMGFGWPPESRSAFIARMYPIYLAEALAKEASRGASS